MKMEVKFLGGTTGVTGSCHLVTAGSKKILIDCGVKQEGDISKNINLPLSEEVDYCILTHAHLDHSGLLPLLVKRKKLRHNVISTAPTRMIAEILLRDFMNIYYHSYGELPYTEKDLESLFSRWIAYDYYKEISIGRLVRVYLYDAAHIIGSASVVVDYGGKYSVLFTGDLGTANSRLLRYPPRHPDSVGYVVMESTYGNVRHENNIERTLKFINHILSNNRGRVLIPSFSVGRAQEVIYMLNKKGIGKEYPIYLDSPMSHKVTVMSDLLSPFLRPLSDLDKNLFRGYIPVNKMKDSIKLAESRDPCIVVSASGMLTGGRVLNHYRYIREDTRSAIVFVGYQAENTLGRRIVDGKEKVKCQVFVAHGFSAHADRKELLDYVRSFGERPKKIFLTHGEKEQRVSLAELLDGNGYYAVLPKEGDVYGLEERGVVHSPAVEEDRNSYGFKKITPEEFKRWFIDAMQKGYIGTQKFDELILVRCSGINSALSWCKMVYSKGRLSTTLGDEYSKREKSKIKKEVYEMFCRASVWLDVPTMRELRNAFVKAKNELRNSKLEKYR